MRILQQPEQLSAVIIEPIGFPFEQMLESDNHILSLYTLYSFYTLSAVINSATGESADSGKRWTSLHAYLSLYLGICIQSVIGGVWACGSSQGEISLSKGPNNIFALSLYIKDRYSTAVVLFSLSTYRNIVSVCEWKDCRPTASYSSSAVPLRSFHRGDE